ncbi:MAG: FtsX-like permease family protein [Candidatus Heimdallarchaeota archaeon]|nr:MAG: FtsX-like permease family protein [Candidatus Heimdallarchaeota archaeon]
MSLDLPDPHFSLGEVIYLSFANIRRRFLRSVITALGIILGITFMAALLTNSLILGLMQAETGVEAYQFWLVGISLVVCFGGITNSMLMAVNERVKEIGVYKCIGGLDSHIIRLFIVEALFLGALGGTIGAIIGMGIGILINLNRFPIEDLTTQIASSSFTFVLMFGLCLFISLVLTALATFIPARRAANMSPAEALRYEN